VTKSPGPPPRWTPGEGSQSPGLFHLRLTGRGDGHEGRQVAVMVQEGVELDPRLGAPEGRPGKERQAEVHHGGVQAVELVFEPELVPGGHGPGSADT
jgi:hypothetical protein